MANIAPMTTAPLTVMPLPDEIDMVNADAIGEDFAAGDRANEVCGSAVSTRYAPSR